MPRLFSMALLGLAGAGVYLKYVRPVVLNWGARPDEVAARLPGDDVVAAPAVQSTRATTIDAAPADIWPWLLQMGPRPRAGIYTYDWLERLLGIDIENSDRILPEFQHLEAGEFLGLNDKGEGLKVLEVRPYEAVVVQWVPAGSTWAFVLVPEGDQTRFISRNRIIGSGPAFWFVMAFMEPGSLVMEWKMLQGFKERAERLKRERLAQPD